MVGLLTFSCSQSKHYNAVPAKQPNGKAWIPLVSSPVLLILKMSSEKSETSPVLVEVKGPVIKLAI